MRNLSNKIKETRKSKGYTQDFMAKKLNISQQMYSKYEKSDRNITIDTLIKVANLLNVTPNDLLDFFNAHEEYINSIK